MNRFISNRSRVFLIIAWVFIFAHFADSVNLTDLFPGITTIHFEEGDGVQSTQELCSIDNPGVMFQNGFNAFKEFFSSQAKINSLKSVILDQDSPSLAATSYNSSESSILSPQEEPLFLRWVQTSESLYLQHHTLLL
jgi:hypothetical protein